MFVNEAGLGLYKREEFVLSDLQNQTEMERRNALRLSNEESNRLTRECIESALVLLMKNTDFHAISITDIIRKAGVSRSAYYRNYTSKEDILTNVFHRAAETIVDALSEPMTQQNMFNCYRVLFAKVHERKKLFEIIEKAGMVYQFQSAVNEKYLSFLSCQPIEQHYRVLSWIGSVFNIIFGWASRNYEETPEQMAEICCDLLSEKDWNIGSGIKWSTDSAKEN